MKGLEFLTIHTCEGCFTELNRHLNIAVANSRKEGKGPYYSQRADIGFQKGGGVISTKIWRFLMYTCNIVSSYPNAILKGDKEGKVPKYKKLIGVIFVHILSDMYSFIHTQISVDLITSLIV